MEKRALGANGPLVSSVGIGAMSFSNMYGPTSEAESHAILDTALELGIDHLDTANIYGMGVSESAIGSWLKSRGENPFTIATKASITKDAEGNRCYDNSAAHLEAELDGSLNRLGLEAVDLFYIHRRDTRFEIEEVTETLTGLIRKGKIKAFGYSEIAPSSLRRAQAVHPVAAVQNEYSLSTRAPELGLVQACAELGTALVAFSPVGRGLLTDTPPDPARIADSGFLANNPRFVEPSLSANLKYIAAFQALAAEMGTSAAALAIAWVLRQGEHVIAIPGTRSVAHLKELAAGGELALSDSDMARIEELLPVGWCHGDRYTAALWDGPERYC